MNFDKHGTFDVEFEVEDTQISNREVDLIPENIVFEEDLPDVKSYPLDGIGAGIGMIVLFIFYLIIWNAQ